MVKIMIAPNRYIQGPGVIKEAGKYIGHLGSHFFFHWRANRAVHCKSPSFDEPR